MAVADSGDAALAFLAACRAWRHPVAVVTRLRLDTAPYAPAAPRRPGQLGRPRKKGRRLPALAARVADPDTVWANLTVASWYGAGPRAVEVASDTAVWYHTGLPPVPLRWVLIRDPQGRFATQALRCTDLTATAEHLLAWFVLRWPLEVTLEEARRHLGVATRERVPRRQWSEGAIRRTTPALLGRFSLVTLLAHEHMTDPATTVQHAAWYRKARPTFVDALALVRRALWRHQTFHTSSCACEVSNVPRAVAEHLTEMLCYAA